MRYFTTAACVMAIGLSVLCGDTAFAQNRTPGNGGQANANGQRQVSHHHHRQGGLNGGMRQGMGGQRMGGGQGMGMGGGQRMGGMGMGGGQRMGGHGMGGMGHGMGRR